MRHMAPKPKSSPTMDRFNPEVTQFLDAQQHPLREAIESLRGIIIQAHEGLEEGIKWNGPNYSWQEKDRITMKIQPPKAVQLVFHRGAKVMAQPPEKLVHDESGLMDWKGNDRAVITFKDKDRVNQAREQITKIVQDWIRVTAE